MDYPHTGVVKSRRGEVTGSIVTKDLRVSTKCSGLWVKGSSPKNLNGTLNRRENDRRGGYVD